jgi:hypothetical protein
MRPQTRNRFWLLLLLFGVTAAPALAEVMDKVSTLGQVWRSAVPLSVMAFALGRLHPLLILVLLVLPNLPLGVFGEIHDRSVGPAIRTEAGMGYVFSVYATDALVLFGYALGVLLWKRRRRL